MGKNNRAIFKFNNGDAALICNKCRKIIKTYQDFTPKEIYAYSYGIALPPQYCDKCKPIKDE